MTETTPETQAPQDQMPLQTEAETKSAPEEQLLNINDVFVATQIIDVAVRRGAFGAGEVADVGMTYNKLIAFLRVTAPQLFEDKQQEKTANERN